MKLQERIEAAIKRITDGHTRIRGTAEQTDPDIVLAECGKEISRLREALGRIAEPIWWMEEDQKRETGSINGLDGALAVALSQDPTFLRGIAQSVLWEGAETLCNSCRKADVSCPIYPQETQSCAVYAEKPKEPRPENVTAHAVKPHPSDDLLSAYRFVFKRRCYSDQELMIALKCWQPEMYALIMKDINGDKPQASK